MSYAAKACRSPSVGCGGYAPLLRRSLVIVWRKPCGRKSGALVYDDLFQCRFHADISNTVWVTDVIEHWTREGKLYLCAIKDLYSRKIVGYAMSSRMKSRLAVEVLEDAMRKRGFPRGVVVHSDRGSQFTSRKFRTALKAYGAKGSMGRGITQRWNPSSLWYKKCSGP